MSEHNARGDAWAYPTLQDWENAAECRATPDFAIGFNAARNGVDLGQFDLGWTMARTRMSHLEELARSSEEGNDCEHE